jgi:hypothetical protein
MHPQSVASSSSSSDPYRQLYGTALELQKRGHCISVVGSANTMKFFNSSLLNHISLGSSLDEVAELSFRQFPPTSSIHRRFQAESFYETHMFALKPIFEAQAPSSPPSASSSSPCHSSHFDMIYSDIDAAASLDLANHFQIPAVLYSLHFLDAIPLSLPSHSIFNSFDHHPSNCRMFDHHSFPELLRSKSSHLAEPPSDAKIDRDADRLVCAFTPSFIDRALAPLQRAWSRLCHWWFFELPLQPLIPSLIRPAAQRQQAWSKHMASSLTPLEFAIRGHLIVFPGTWGFLNTLTAIPLPPHIVLSGTTSPLAIPKPAGHSSSAELPLSIQAWLRELIVSQGHAVNLIETVAPRLEYDVAREFAILTSDSEGPQQLRRTIWLVSGIEFESIQSKLRALNLDSRVAVSSTLLSSPSTKVSVHQVENTVSVDVSATVLYLCVFEGDDPVAASTARSALVDQVGNLYRQASSSSSASSSAPAFVTSCVIGTSRLMDAISLGWSAHCFRESPPSPNDLNTAINIWPLLDSFGGITPSSVRELQDQLRLAPGAVGLVDRFEHVRAFGVSHIILLDWSAERIASWQAELFTQDWFFIWAALFLLFLYSCMRCCYFSIAKCCCCCCKS